jgi:hypothetical protein
MVTVLRSLTRERRPARRANTHLRRPASAVTILAEIILLPVPIPDLHTPRSTQISGPGVTASPGRALGSPARTSRPVD